MFLFSFLNDVSLYIPLETKRDKSRILPISLKLYLMPFTLQPSNKKVMKLPTITVYTAVLELTMQLAGEAI